MISEPYPFLAASLPTARMILDSGFPPSNLALISERLSTSSGSLLSVGLNISISTPQCTTLQFQDFGTSYLNSKSSLVAFEFATQILDSFIAKFSNLEYHPAMNLIATSFTLAQTADSLALLASIKPSRSPSQDPCREDTTGATFSEHLLNCDLDHDIIGQWRWTMSTGSLSFSLSSSKIALLPYERVNSIGILAHPTSITFTPVCDGGSPAPDLVITVTL